MANETMTEQAVDGFYTLVEHSAQAQANFHEAMRVVADLLPWAEGAHEGGKTCDCARCDVTRAAREVLAKHGYAVDAKTA